MNYPHLDENESKKFHRRPTHETVNSTIRAFNERKENEIELFRYTILSLEEKFEKFIKDAFPYNMNQIEKFYIYLGHFLME